MNSEQRQLLYDKLLEGTPPELCVEMADMVNEDLDAIEPIIDDFLKAAAAGSIPTNWQAHDLAITFIQEPAHCILDIRMGIRRFSVQIERARLRELGQAMIQNSGLMDLGGDGYV